MRSNKWYKRHSGWITILVFRPRYPYPSITHTTLSCLVVLKYLFSLATLFQILLILSAFLACYNNSNGDTGYFNSFLPCCSIKSPSVLDNESIFTACFFRIFAFFLPSSSSFRLVTTMVMVILASSIHCFTLLLHYKSICFG